jgi:3-oxoacyl-[acyl-carrier-protein] synthase-3
VQGLRIAGTGSYLPGPPLDQDAVRRFLRRHPDGLTEREQDHLLESSGIATRHYAIDVDDPTRRESNTTMAAEAGRRALAAAGWTPNDVELLVVTTVVPDQLMPPTSTLVQEALGIARCTELEISANCTAPTKGLMVAANHLRVGECGRALVCSSQYVSFLGVPPWTNPERMSADQGHLRWLLSDGAAALALERSDRDIGLRVCLESTGVGKRSGMSVALGAADPDLAAAFGLGGQHITQDQRYVLKEGFPRVVDGLQSMLSRLEVPGASIDHFIPSVPSLRTATKLQGRAHKRLGIRPEAGRLNFTRVGYVGSVAVPIMLDELARAGTLRPGDTVCTVAEESSKWMFAGTVFRWNP